MAKYLMFGKYSAEAVKGMTPQRTRTVVETIEKAGGKVNAMYALLGCHDLAFVVDFPGTAEVMKASIAITKATGIGITSSPAMTVEEFDRITG
jgi:uncharacterized protein with GYD domain